MSFLGHGVRAAASVLLALALADAPAGAAPTVATSPPTESPSWTLAQAVRESEARAPELASARAVADVAAARRRRGWSGLFPTITAEGLGSVRKDAFTAPSLLFGGEPYNYYVVGLTGEQPIYAGGALVGTLAASAAELDRADAELRRVRRARATSTIEGFYRLLFQQRALEVRRAQRRVLEDLLSSAQRKSRIGTGKRLDTYLLQTQVAQAEPEILEAEKELRVAAADLAAQVGRSAEGSLGVRGAWPTAEALGETAAAIPGEVIHPELRAAEAAVRAAEGIRRATLAPHLPRLSLEGQVLRNATRKQDLLESDRTSWNVGVRLRIPLFSGLSSWAERAEQTALVRVSEAKLDEERRRTGLAEIQAAETLRLSRAKARAAEKALEFARAASREARANWGNGTATFSQLSEAQRAWLDSELSTERAAFDATLASAHWRVAAGLELDDWVTRAEGK